MRCRRLVGVRAVSSTKYTKGVVHEHLDMPDDFPWYLRKGSTRFEASFPWPGLVLIQAVGSTKCPHRIQRVTLCFFE